MISRAQLDELRDMLNECDEGWLQDHISIVSDGCAGVFIAIDNINEQHLPDLLGKPYDNHIYTCSGPLEDRMDAIGIYVPESPKNTADVQQIVEALRRIASRAPERPAQRAFNIERRETVSALRRICQSHGDNDWPDDLHLADVLEKHLERHLEPPR